MGSAVCTTSNRAKQHHLQESMQPRPRCPPKSQTSDEKAQMCAMFQARRRRRFFLDFFWVVTDDDFQTSFLDSDFTLSPKGFILHCQQHMIRMCSNYLVEGAAYHLNMPIFFLVF